MAGILIVEDEKDIRDMLKISLLRHKYTVLEAVDGKDAIAHFRPSMTDLVITDLLMPYEDGLKVIMKLREIKPSVKIIAISGGGKAGPGSYLNMAKALGANAVDSQPFSINDLIAKIKLLINDEQDN